jgi:hypothetical protein
MAGHWTSDQSQPAVPTLDQWPRLMAALKVDEVPPEIQRLAVELNGMKGQPGAAWFQREVTGTVEEWENRSNYALTSRDGLRRDKPASDAAIQWAGWGTALKPAWEPILLARKPFAMTVARNALEHGTGALNIDACRIIGSETGEPIGRWPANVVLDSEAAAMLDAQSPDAGASSPVRGTEPSAATNGVYNPRARVPSGELYVDAGGASRFFYTAKAARSERDAGLDVEAGERNRHPTVKPLDLMQWLVRLVCRRGGLVLDPFMGSGTTGRAAVAEGMRFVGIDKDAASADIARARIVEYAPLFMAGGEL